MKKILYILCAMVLFASCSKEKLPTTDGQTSDGTYTFNVGIEEPDYAPRSRAVANINRYVMEIYDGTLTTLIKKTENTDGVFKVELKKGVDYVCLFWADGGSGTYDTYSLQAVKQSDNTKTGTAAYYAKVEVNSNTFNGAVKLKRAVAELSFIDKNGLNKTNNTLVITYPYASAAFNLADGTVNYKGGTAEHTISNIGTSATLTAFATDFILAPTTVGNLAGLKFKLNRGREKTVEATTIRANFKAEIKGEYQPKAPKIGDFYYENNSWSPIYEDNGINSCIGIVCEVSLDGNSGRNGKIMNFTEQMTVQWCQENLNLDGTSDDDGAINTAKIIAIETTTAIKFRAIISGRYENERAGIKWYLPAVSELKHNIYANRDVLQASLDMVTKKDMKDLVLEDKKYWSSTDHESPELAKCVDFSNGEICDDNVAGLYKIRTIAIF